MACKRRQLAYSGGGASLQHASAVIESFVEGNLMRITRVKLIKPDPKHTLAQQLHHSARGTQNNTTYSEPTSASSNWPSLKCRQPILLSTSAGISARVTSVNGSREVADVGVIRCKGRWLNRDCDFSKRIGVGKEYHPTINGDENRNSLVVGVQCAARIEALEQGGQVQPGLDIVGVRRRHVP